METTSKYYLDYLLSHIEFEHILLDTIDMFNCKDISLLYYSDLEYLIYGF